MLKMTAQDVKSSGIARIASFAGDGVFLQLREEDFVPVKASTRFVEAAADYGFAMPEVIELVEKQEERSWYMDFIRHDTARQKPALAGGSSTLGGVCNHHTPNVPTGQGG